MAKARMGAKVAAGCLLLWGTAAEAAPTAADMLRFRPKQEGVVFTTPTAEADQAACTVEPIKRTVQGKESIIGWVLRDKNKQILRRFFDTTGTGKTDAWCYYNNGTEVYREIYSPAGDQYRWLNGAGMKWGVDLNHDGKIDTWRAISAEEVSQEILQAVAKKDYARLQALMVSETELKALDLPTELAGQIRESEKNAPAKFQKTLEKLGTLGDKVRWVHLETDAPQCIPADGSGMKQDLLKYGRGTLTFINETDNKPVDLATGELIQIGQSWRLVDAPVPSDGPAPPPPPGDPRIQAFLGELKLLDEKPPKGDSPQPEIVQYNLKRAEILDKIIAVATGDEFEQYVRQEADCLSAAVQNSPNNEAVAYPRLVALRDRILKEQPTSGLASHLFFCEMSADYSRKLNDKKPDFDKIQKEWVEKLTKFVQDYPKGEDTADALMQLGMVSELIGEEEKAKKWYELLIKDFPTSPQAAKAKGCLTRLTLDGKEMVLAGSTLGTKTPFDIKSMKGKVIAVYFWASWNSQSAGDFAKFKTLLTTYGSKGFEVVCVNLDDNPALATAFLQKNPAPGTHLYEDGGLNSKLAEPYGIQVLPTMFLVGKEGKVVSRTVQMNNLEDEVQKAMK